MVEYIDREALVSELKRLGFGDSSLFEKIISDGVYTVIGAMPAVSVPQWISVKDRLPRNYMEVMAFDAIDRDMFLGVIGSSGEWEIPGFRTDKFNITHWMPLPEAPKGDADNG